MLICSRVKSRIAVQSSKIDREVMSEREYKVYILESKTQLDGKK
jgi:hypothetical protein